MPSRTPGKTDSCSIYLPFFLPCPVRSWYCGDLRVAAVHGTGEFPIPTNLSLLFRSPARARCGVCPQTPAIHGTRVAVTSSAVVCYPGASSMWVLRIILGRGCCLPGGAWAHRGSPDSRVLRETYPPHRHEHRPGSQEEGIRGTAH